MANGLGEMNGNRRFLVLGIAAALLIGAIFLGKSATAPTFVTLFRDMELAEVGNITDALDKAGITYRLELGGSEIQVAEPDAARAKVLLAKDGLPARGRPGLELFDRPAWGMTDFTQHVTYRRALEGELARTIGALRGVKSAQVHLAIPEASPLRRLEQPAEAAVVLALQPGASLDAGQVRGIAQLVSSSVERMPVDRVAVLDDSGRPLTGTVADDGDLGLTSKQMELQQGVEKHLLSKVEPIVQAVVGPGASRVQVSAKLNFDQVERNTEQFDPQGQVLSSESRSRNGTGADSAAASQTQSSNFQNSRRIEKIVSELGNVTKLSVSVLVDAHRFNGDAALADTRRAQLEQVIRTAVGYDSTRGDQVEVVAVPFDGAAVAQVAAPPEAEPKPTMVQTAERFAMPGVAAFAVLAAFLLGWRALRPAKRGLAVAMAGGGGGAAAASADGMMAMAEAPVVETPEHVQRRNRVAADSISAPEAAARVVRAWLAEVS